MARCCPEDSDCYTCSDAEAGALDAQFEAQAVEFQRQVADYQHNLLVVQQMQPDLPLYQQQLLAQQPSPPPLVVPGDSTNWFTTADPVSPSQPPIIAIDQPTTAAANAGAGSGVASVGVLDWLQQSTVVAGYPIPHWGLLAGGLGALMLLGSKKGKRR